MSNAVLEQIQQVLGNPVRTFNIPQTYVDGYDPCTGILASASFGIRSTTNRLKGYGPGKLVFGRDMILSIKHEVHWELIRQRKQAKIN